MADTIFNPDGSVYMTFGPSVPSSGALEKWQVRHVCSVHRTPGRVEWDGTRWAPVTWTQGTIGLVTSDCRSFNDLLGIVGEMSDDYGYRPPSSRIGDGTFRWTWERWSPDGTHMSDMIIATKID